MADRMTPKFASSQSSGAYKTTSSNVLKEKNTGISTSSSIRTPQGSLKTKQQTTKSASQLAAENAAAAYAKNKPFHLASHLLAGGNSSSSNANTPNRSTRTMTNGANNSNKKDSDKKKLAHLLQSTIESRNQLNALGTGGGGGSSGASAKTTPSHRALPFSASNRLASSQIPTSAHHVSTSTYSSKPPTATSRGADSAAEINPIYNGVDYSSQIGKKAEYGYSGPGYIVEFNCEPKYLKGLFVNRGLWKVISNQTHRADPNLIDLGPMQFLSRIDADPDKKTPSKTFTKFDFNWRPNFFSASTTTTTTTSTNTNTYNNSNNTERHPSSILHTKSPYAAYNNGTYSAYSLDLETRQQPKAKKRVCFSANLEHNLGQIDEQQANNSPAIDNDDDDDNSHHDRDGSFNSLSTGAKSSRAALYSPPIASALRLKGLRRSFSHSDLNDLILSQNDDEHDDDDDDVDDGHNTYTTTSTRDDNVAMTLPAIAVNGVAAVANDSLLLAAAGPLNSTYTTSASTVASLTTATTTTTTTTTTAMQANTSVDNNASSSSANQTAADDLAQRLLSEDTSTEDASGGGGHGAGDAIIVMKSSCSNLLLMDNAAEAARATALADVSDIANESDSDRRTGGGGGDASAATCLPVQLSTIAQAVHTAISTILATTAADSDNKQAQHEANEFVVQVNALVQQLNKTIESINTPANN